MTQQEKPTGYAAKFAARKKHHRVVTTSSDSSPIRNPNHSAVQTSHTLPDEYAALYNNPSMVGQTAYNEQYAYDWNYNNYGPIVPNYTGYHPFQSGYTPVFQQNVYPKTQQGNTTKGGGKVVYIYPAILIFYDTERWTNIFRINVICEKG